MPCQRDGGLADSNDGCDGSRPEGPSFRNPTDKVAKEPKRKCDQAQLVGNNLSRLCLLCGASNCLAERTFKSLAGFTRRNGETPNAVIQGLDGNFYGTTAYGGGVQATAWSSEVTPAGKVTEALSSFSFGDCAYPEGSLVLSTNGSFYGITYRGGVNRWRRPL